MTTSYTGLKTENGSTIHSYDHIEKLRAVEEEKRRKKQPSRNFISQTGAQEHVQHSDADCDGTGGNRGGGKANTYATPVATPTGFRRMGDLQVGDYICTPYEGIQQVTDIFEQGKQTVYTLHFDDGTHVTCMDNHRFYGRSHPLEAFKTWEARDIFELYRIDQQGSTALRNRCGYQFEIPLCGEVEIGQLTASDCKLHPFVAGLLSSSGFFEFHGSKFYAKNNTMIRRIVYFTSGISSKTTSSSSQCCFCVPASIRKLLVHRRQPHVPANIPDEYMNGTPDVRWQFIRGVMFFAGKSKSKHPRYETQCLEFAQQLARMARSLGVWAAVVDINDDPERMGWYRVLFKHADEKKFWFLTARKQKAQNRFAELTEKPKEGNELYTKKLLYITKQKTKQDCRCITVSGNDHLYLTNEYTINHNTAMLLTKPLPDIQNRYFNGIIFRKNKGDFENIISETKKWYEPFGRYNKSADDMTWNFNYGSHLSLSFFDMPYKDFDDKYRGQQFAYIGIDEAPQMSYKMFKFLTTCNRNTNNIKSRILFTCNPDPLSWLRKFLDWYIGKEDTIYEDGKLHPERKGFIIPERSGKIRYFYSPDDIVDNIVWGNTPYDVYRQIKDIADEGWNENLRQFGHTRETYLVKSFRFTKADLLDNKALMALDEDYIKNLYQQPPEVRARELEGNWDIIKTGDDLIQPFHLDKIFHNAPIYGDNIRRASCDVAGTGGDNCVTWFKIGNHIADVFVCRRDPYSTIPLLKAKLKEWGVLEQNFTFDLQGMGQVLKGAFPNAVPFNNQAACDDENRKLYDCVKSQAAYLFAQHTQQGEWSIEPTLLDREYQVGGVTMRLYNILQSERKAIRQDMSKQDRGWCLIHKEQMKHKSLVGHSPDFIEALSMFEIFNIEEVEDVEIPVFLNSHVRNVRTFNFS